MSDIAKWALLVAGALVIIGMILTLPFTEFLVPDQFTTLIGTLVEIAGDGFIFGRGVINNFLTPYGRAVLTGLLYWFFGKWAITISFKIVVWVYHFIFK